MWLVRARPLPSIKGAMSDKDSASREQSRCCVRRHSETQPTQVCPHCLRKARPKCRGRRGRCVVQVFGFSAHTCMHVCSALQKGARAAAPHALAPRERQAGQGIAVAATRAACIKSGPVQRARVREGVATCLLEGPACGRVMGTYAHGLQPSSTRVTCWGRGQ